MSSGPPNKRLRQTMLSFAKAHGAREKPGISGDMEKLIKMAQIENWKIQNVPSDGDCMFSSIALQLGRSITEASIIRSEIVQYLRDHPDMLFNSGMMEQPGVADKYLSTMSQKGTWGDGIVLDAAANLYKRAVLVVSPESRHTHDSGLEESTADPDPIRLAYIDINHYVSLKPVPAVVPTSVHISEQQPSYVTTTVDQETVVSPEVNNSPPPDTAISSSSSVGDITSTMEKPFHPSIGMIAPQVMKDGKRILHFQSQWFEMYPWLHYSVEKKAVLCFYCAKAEALRLTELAKKRESAFTTDGFRNWKKARERFEMHANSSSHIYSLSQLSHSATAKTVNQQISVHHEQAQSHSRSALHVICTTVKFLARQGLALRGHLDSEGNLQQLLQLRASDSILLKQWMERKADMTSPLIQNEILQLYSQDIVRKIVDEVHNAGTFAVMVDGTQDVSRKEQLSICIRYVDQDLNPVEQFVGLYEPPSTSGEVLAICIKDALLRLQLPLSGLRGQTYDGASNMSGCYSGCQALIAKDNPLALYVHCGAHCANLVSQSVSEAVVLVRNAMQTVQELGKLFSQSINCRTTFAKIAESELGKVRLIRPLCPTRWLVRVRAIQDILNQYEAILDCLEETASSHSHVSARAMGLRTQLDCGETLLGLKMAYQVFGVIEQLNRSLQSTSQSVAGMLSAVSETIDNLVALRADKVFDELMTETITVQTALNMTPLSLPRQRKTPQRLSGVAVDHVATTVSEHYRPMFYSLIDTAVVQLKQRFNNDGLMKYGSVEDVLLSGIVNEELLEPFVELNVCDLKLQLQHFRRKRSVKSVRETIKIMQEMAPEVRGEYCEVEKLVRLLLVNPASSCEAERSFSALRRLKTWLRSTMTQVRLNAVAVCHIHQHLLDDVSDERIVQSFVAKSESRAQLFGK